jgi:hypothetical protein
MMFPDIRYHHILYYIILYYIILYYIILYYIIYIYMTYDFCVAFCGTVHIFLLYKEQHDINIIFNINWNAQGLTLPKWKDNVRNYVMVEEPERGGDPIFMSPTLFPLFYLLVALLSYMRFFFWQKFLVRLKKTRDRWGDGSLSAKVYSGEGTCRGDLQQMLEPLLLQTGGFIEEEGPGKG